MSNPKAIDVPNLGFTEVQTTILQIMMNKEEIDYSTVDKLTKVNELSAYHYDKLCDSQLGMIINFPAMRNVQRRICMRMLSRKNSSRCAIESQLTRTIF